MACGFPMLALLFALVDTVHLSHCTRRRHQYLLICCSSCASVAPPYYSEKVPRRPCVVQVMPGSICAPLLAFCRPLQQQWGSWWRAQQQNQTLLFIALPSWQRASTTSTKPSTAQGNFREVEAACCWALPSVHTAAEDLNLRPTHMVLPLGQLSRSKELLLLCDRPASIRYSTTKDKRADVSNSHIYSPIDCICIVYQYSKTFLTDKHVDNTIFQSVHSMILSGSHACCLHEFQHLVCINRCCLLCMPALQSCCLAICT